MNAIVSTSGPLVNAAACIPAIFGRPDGRLPPYANDSIDFDVMITAKQVTHRLGVSASTVGRAFADDPRISTETKVRVRHAARQFGYVANMPARVVRGASSNLIGLVLPNIKSDFYATFAQVLSTCCEREDVVSRFRSPMTT